MCLINIVDNPITSTPTVTATNVSGTPVVWHWYTEDISPEAAPDLNVVACCKKPVGPPPYNLAVKVAIWKVDNKRKRKEQKPTRKPDQEEIVFIVSSEIKR
jgi:hypothetical protein